MECREVCGGPISSRLHDQINLWAPRRGWSIGRCSRCCTLFLFYLIPTVRPRRSRVSYRISLPYFSHRRSAHFSPLNSVCSLSYAASSTRLSCRSSFKVAVKLSPAFRPSSRVNIVLRVEATSCALSLLVLDTSRLIYHDVWIIVAHSNSAIFSCRGSQWPEQPTVN